MKRNQIQKGARVLLSDGIEADIMDGYKNRNIRNMMVYASAVGFFDERGDEYTSKIIAVKVNEKWENVT